MKTIVGKTFEKIGNQNVGGTTASDSFFTPPMPTTVKVVNEIGDRAWGSVTLSDLETGKLSITFTSAFLTRYKEIKK